MPKKSAQTIEEIDDEEEEPLSLGYGGMRNPPAPFSDTEEVLIETEEALQLREANKELLSQRKTIESMEEVLADAKQQQTKIAKLLQVQGLKAIRDNRARIYKAKDALSFLQAGVELERKVLGMDEEQGNPVINIITQQQNVFGKYVKQKEEVKDD